MCANSGTATHPGRALLTQRFMRTYDRPEPTAMTYGDKHRKNTITLTYVQNSNDICMNCLVYTLVRLLATAPELCSVFGFAQFSDNFLYNCYRSPIFFCLRNVYEFIHYFRFCARTKAFLTLHKAVRFLQYTFCATFCFSNPSIFTPNVVGSRIIGIKVGRQDVDFSVFHTYYFANKLQIIFSMIMITFNLCFFTIVDISLTFPICPTFLIHLVTLPTCPELTMVCLYAFHLYGVALPMTSASHLDDSLVGWHLQLYDFVRL